MNKLNYFLTVIVLIAIAGVVGCKKDSGDNTPAVDKVGNLFAGNWKATNVTFEGASRSADYDGTNGQAFALTYTYTAGSNGGQMSHNGGGPVGVRPFLDSDSWSYQTPAAVALNGSFNIVRASDGLVMTVENLTETSMRMTFLFSDTNQTSKMSAVAGTWVFDFVK